MFFQSMFLLLVLPLGSSVVWEKNARCVCLSVPLFLKCTLAGIVPSTSFLGGRGEGLFNYILKAFMLKKEQRTQSRITSLLYL